MIGTQQTRNRWLQQAPKTPSNLSKSESKVAIKKQDQESSNRMISKLLTGAELLLVPMVHIYFCRICSDFKSYLCRHHPVKTKLSKVQCISSKSVKFSASNRFYFGGKGIRITHEKPNKVFQKYKKIKKPTGNQKNYLDILIMHRSIGSSLK